MPITDIIVATSGLTGKKIGQNATNLSEDLAEAAEAMSLVDENVFSTNDIVVIEEELIKIDSEAGNPIDITRAQEGSADDDHPGPVGEILGANVRLKEGTTLLSFEFTGAESVTGIAVGGETEAIFGIKFTHGETVVWDIVESTPQWRDRFIPYREFTPDNGDTIDIVVWSWYSTPTIFRATIYG